MHFRLFLKAQLTVAVLATIGILCSAGLVSGGSIGYDQLLDLPPDASALPASSAPTPVRTTIPLVYVSRQPVRSDDPGAIPGFGPRYRTVVVGGKLMVRRADGRDEVMLDTTRIIDVSNPSVSWDAKTIIFAGIEHPDSNWRIYRINADGSGLTRLTNTDRVLDLSQFGAAASRFDRYDDFDPCYLPDGRIVFATTRYPLMAMYDALPASNLFVMHADGSHLRRITTERNGAEEPTIDPLTGRIVYARWWANRDRPSNSTREGLSRSDEQALTIDEANIWHAVTIKPDGDEVKLYAGFARTRAGMQTYKPFIMNDGRLLGTYTANSPLIDGLGGTGIRWFAKGPSVEHHILGVQPDVDANSARGVAPPYAAGPIQLDKERILFSYAPDGTDYGLYVCKLDGSGLSKFVDLPGTHELDAQVLRPRPVPPVLKDEFEHEPSQLPPTEDPLTYFKDDFFRFDCMNIFANAGVDVPIPDAPRITSGARIRFFTNFQRQNPRFPDPSIFLKDAPVFYHGGVHEHDVPAEVPLFEQVVDAHGKVLMTTDGKFAHVSGFNYERQGAGTKCVGCHVGHSMMEVPINGSMAEWFNAAPSANVSASSFYSEGDERVFSPRRIVDRQARTGGDTVVWIASEQSGAWVTLHWDMPIEVRELVLYNIPPKPSTRTTLQIHECEIMFYLDGIEVGRKLASGRLSKDGTSVPVSPVVVDALKIVVKKSSGKVLDRPYVGLAEVETIARLIAEVPTTQKGS